MKATSVWWDLVNVMLTGGIFGEMLLLSGFANAQVTPDGTLNTTVSQTGNNFTITNGSTAGSNLFHSFQKFSVPAGGSATFDLVNTPNISTIFSRVTGGSVSNIDGMIRTTGSNNPISLFLLNPSGILFGPNASLNIGGSFVGTTAQSIKFADEFKFNATDATPPPLLTMSVPVGLQMGANAGTIRSQGKPALNFFFRPSQLFQTQTLALVGGDIDIQGATLSIPEGRVELWAVRNAEVGLNNQTGLQLTNLTSTAEWGTITLRQSSLIDTTGIFTSAGVNGGAINIRGRGLTLQEGSGISIATGPFGQGQSITVQTTEFVNLLGISAPENYSTPGIFTSAFGNGAKAGDITIETQRLRIANGGWLQSIINFGFDLKTFMPIPVNDARSGNITVRASDVEVSGYNPFPVSSFQPSSITTVITGGKRNESGNISIDAQRVRLLDGGRITSDLLGFNFPGFESMVTGKSGDISIRASESLKIAGVTPAGVSGGISSSIQPLAEGQGGNIAIDSGQLLLSNGGSISSALAGSGKAGNINIRATKVAVGDPVLDSLSKTFSGITVAVAQDAIGQGGNITVNADRLRVFNGGQISSSSLGQGSAGSVNLRVNDINVQGFSQPLPDGRQLPSTIAASSANAFTARSVNIAANTLRVRDGAEITVSNSGTGNAGNLNVTASNIFLDNGATLKAEANGGSRGNIRLQASNFLLLRHGSNITTNARGTSTGGNIIINAKFIAAVPQENSDIAANAVLGSGGNIQIVTQGLLGLEFRNQLTSESDITANSQFGVSGTVQINAINLEPNSGLVEQPANVTNPSQQIATGCAGSEGSRFVATGRGGVPPNPNQQVMSDRAWNDVRDLSAYRKIRNVTAQAPPSPEVIVEATSWHRNADGKVELIAAQSPTHVQQPLTCAAVPRS